MTNLNPKEEARLSAMELGICIARDRVSAMELGLSVARDWIPSASATELERVSQRAQDLIEDEWVNWYRVTIPESAWGILAETRGGIYGEPLYLGEFVRGFMLGVELWCYASVRTAKSVDRAGQCATCSGELAGWYL